MKKIMIAVLLTISMLLSACGGSAPESSEAEQSESAPAESEEAKPTNTPVPQVSETFSGKLTDYSYGTFVVEANATERTFKSSAYTFFDLSGNKNLSLGDTLDITYHEEKNENIADRVVVAKHEDEVRVFQGIVASFANGQLVVTGTEMTVLFAVDDKTAVAGNLSDGDGVAVTYTGNLNELPYAVSVTVTSENQAPLIYLVSGTVSEVSKDSIMLSISSASAYRVMINEKTKITGKEKIVAVGDTVTVMYTESKEKVLTAIEIEILKHKKDEEYSVINGVIDTVSDKTFTLLTKENTYKFTVGEKIVYSGEKIAPKQQATVTYTGELKKDPVAVKVYCSGILPDPTPTPTETPTPTPTETPTPTPTETPTPEPTETPTPEPTETPTPEPTETPTPDPTETPTPEPTETPTPEPTETPTPEPTETPEPEPVPAVYVEGSGTILEWRTGYRILTEMGKEISLTIDPEIEIASGYLPEEGDIVKFTYEANEMALTELELVGKERDYDAGWITAWADNKVTVLLVNGDELELTVDGETIDVLPGYEPKLNDFIYLVYDEDTMELTYVRFLSRPEKLETNDLYKSVLELNKKDKDE